MTDYNDSRPSVPQGQPAPAAGASGSDATAPQPGAVPPAGASVGAGAPAGDPAPVVGASIPGAAQQPGAVPPASAGVGASAGDPAQQQAGWQGQAPAGAAPSGWQAQPGAGGTVPPQPQSPYAAAPVPPQPQPQPVAQPAYAEGCVKAAWRDVTASEGWKGRMALLGLIGCVPILNFVVYGYGLNWSREVPFGAKSPMPRETVTGRNFEYGFYYFLVSLVVSLVIGVASAIVGWVPLLGWAAAIALWLFGMMFIPLLGTRMAMMGSLGEGFQAGRAWETMKRNWTALLAAGVLPSLIVGIAVSLIGLVFMAVGMVGLIGPLMALGAGYGSAGTVAAVGSAGLLGVVLAAVWYVVCAAGSAMATIVTMRAVAHWVGRYAPEWAADAWRAAQMRY